MTDDINISSSLRVLPPPPSLLCSPGPPLPSPFLRLFPAQGDCEPDRPEASHTVVSWCLFSGGSGGSPVCGGGFSVDERVLRVTFHGTLKDVCVTALVDGLQGAVPPSPPHPPPPPSDLRLRHTSVSSGSHPHPQRL